ncbi:MAG: DUF4296 domain-containing protein [Ignavibacteriaceae bacterium]
MSERKKYLWILAPLVIILVVAGYYFLTPKVIPEDTFIRFYIDFTIAQDSMGPDVPVTNKILSNLYKKYSVDSTQYFKTINWYSEDPKRWETFFDKAIKLMEDKNLLHKDSLQKSEFQK